MGRTHHAQCNQNSIVECAFFQPEAIIGKSVKYDIQSEASHKFERGVDPECHERFSEDLLKLLASIQYKRHVYYFL